MFLSRLCLLKKEIYSVLLEGSSVGFRKVKEPFSIYIEPVLTFTCQMVAKQVEKPCCSLPDVLHLTCAIDNRMGCAEFTLPPRTGGPPPHWHIMVGADVHEGTSELKTGGSRLT